MIEDEVNPPPIAWRAYPHIVQYRTADGALHDLPPRDPQTLHEGYATPRGPGYVAVIHDHAAYADLMKRGGHHPAVRPPASSASAVAPPLAPTRRGWA